jgi:hypothetical protein
MDSHLHFIEDLTAILDSGIRYSIQRVGDQFLVRLGEPQGEPMAATSVDDIGQAVSWLREQVKVHYPDSAYVKGQLTN